MHIEGISSQKEESVDVKIIITMLNLLLFFFFMMKRHKLPGLWIRMSGAHAGVVKPRRIMSADGFSHEKCCVVGMLGSPFCVYQLLK